MDGSAFNLLQHSRNFPVMIAFNLSKFALNVNMLTLQEQTSRRDGVDFGWQK